MHKILGVVTEEEKKAVEQLTKRLEALKVLNKTLETKKIGPEAMLYQLIKEDMAKTKEQFANWWKQSIEKYKWSEEYREHLSINFDTNEIFTCKSA